MKPTRLYRAHTTLLISLLLSSAPLLAEADKRLQVESPLPKKDIPLPPPVPMPYPRVKTPALPSSSTKGLSSQAPAINNQALTPKTSTSTIKLTPETREQLKAAAQKKKKTTPQKSLPAAAKTKGLPAQPKLPTKSVAPKAQIKKAPKLTTKPQAKALTQPSKPSLAKPINKAMPVRQPKPINKTIPTRQSEFQKANRNLITPTSTIPKAVAPKPAITLPKASKAANSELKLGTATRSSQSNTVGIKPPQNKLNSSTIRIAPAANLAGQKPVSSTTIGSQVKLKLPAPDQIYVNALRFVGNFRAAPDQIHVNALRFVGNFQTAPDQIHVNALRFFGNFQAAPDQIHVNTLRFIGNFQAAPDQIHVNALRFIGNYQPAPDRIEVRTLRFQADPSLFVD